MAYEVVVGRNEDDRKRLGLRGCILVGKHYVKMGQTSSLSNEVWMDVSRSHVVFVCGKRGSGKCLTGDTLVTLGDGRQVPLQELDRTTGNPIGLNNDFKVQELSREGFYKRTVNKILNITLRSGKSIRLTPEHPLLTVRGWVNAEHLNINDRIATPRKTPHGTKQTLTTHEVLLLAYLIAEGDVKKSMVRFTNHDDGLVQEFTRATNATDNNAKIVQYKPGQYAIVNKKIHTNTEHIVRGKDGRFKKGSKIKNQPTKISNWLHALGLRGKKANEKFIPPIMFEQDEERLQLFLSRLFSCDGTVYCKQGRNNHAWQIQYTSKSEQLIRQVQTLLTRFSVISQYRQRTMRLKEKTFIAYELTINNPEQYLATIGFHGEKTSKAAQAKNYFATTTRNPNIDTIPKDVWDHYRPQNWAAAGRAFGYAHPKALRESIHYAPSRQKLQQIAINDEREDIQRLAEADIYWDYITSIEVQQGSFQVYDITVPNYHNFVANDIIVHNSYTLGVIAEGISNLEPDVARNIAVLILDTMGIYWTMKYPNQRDRELLNDWKLLPKGLDVEVFVPHGRFQEMIDQQIPADKPFSINPSELDPSQWPIVFGLSSVDEVGALLEHTATVLQETKGFFSLEDFHEALTEQHADNSAVLGAQNLVQAASLWGLFGEETTRINDVVSPGKVSVLDVSSYSTSGSGWDVRSLVIGIIAQKLFAERMLARKKEEHEALEEELTYQPQSRRDEPIIWILIDEAHEFLPNKGKTPATDALIKLLREGRQPGISLVLATQQPGKIHTDVMTQSDIIVSHRITARVDTDALQMLTQSYMRGDLDVLLNELPRFKGAAIVLDDNNEKLYSMRVRPRFTWHGGSDPDALSGEKSL